MSWNNELRKEIVDLVKRSGEGISSVPSRLLTLLMSSTAIF